MTVIAVGTGDARPGKMAEAHEAILAVAQYVNETYGVTVEVMKGVDGPVNRFLYVVRHDSWQRREEVTEVFGQDEKGQELFQHLAEALDVEKVSWRHYVTIGHN